MWFYIAETGDTRERGDCIFYLVILSCYFYNKIKLNFGTYKYNSVAVTTVAVV
jgi:hypothetical protein